MAELLANSPTPGQRLAVGELASELTEAAKGAKALKLKLAIAKQTGLRAAGEARVIIDKEIIRIATVAAAETELEIIERGAEESTAAPHASGSSVFCEPTVGSLNARYAFINAAAGGDLTGEYPNPTVGAGKISNAKIEAAAGIPESKLSLPEAVLKTGFQAVPGEKEFKAIKAERVAFYGAREIASLSNLVLEGVGGITGTLAIGPEERVRLGGELTALKEVKLSGKIENGTQFETEADFAYKVVPEGGAAEIASIKQGTGGKHRAMLWVNASPTETLTLLHEGAGLAGNRFFFASKKAVKLEPGNAILLWYAEGESPSSKERWRDVGGWSWNFAAKQHAAIANPIEELKAVREKLEEALTVLKEHGLTA